MKELSVTAWLAAVIAVGWFVFGGSSVQAESWSTWNSNDHVIGYVVDGGRMDGRGRAQWDA